MDMPTDTSFLTLAQWLSPAFPVGAFAYSQGLEAAVDLRWVQDARSFEEWLADLLEYGAGRSDTLFLAAAYHAPDAATVKEIGATACAYAATSERLLETQAQGAAFCKVVSTVWDARLEDLPYPVALGAGARHQGLQLTLTSAMYLQAIASNLIAAAQRLLPLGQTEGQAILRRLAGRCDAVALSTSHGDLSRLSTTTFLGDIAAMKHETQYSRIFRT